jgi:hypothetical protein
VESQAAVGEHAAGEVIAKFALDEAGYGVVSLSSPHDKGLELFANGLVEERLLWTARCVVSAAIGGEAGGVAAAGIPPGRRCELHAARRNARARAQVVRGEGSVNAGSHDGRGAAFTPSSKTGSPTQPASPATEQFPLPRGRLERLPRAHRWPQRLQGRLRRYVPPPLDPTRRPHRGYRTLGRTPAQIVWGALDANS